MPVLPIQKLKVISPSPDNFILSLEVSNKTINYIGSGEHIYQNKNQQIDQSLITSHLAHSSIFKFGGDTVLTAFNLFDINDMGITTEEDETHDNLLLLQQASYEPKARIDKPIKFHVINSNSTYGYISAEASRSFGYPVYKRNDLIKIDYGMAEFDSDPLTRYHKRKFATSISATLGLGNQSNNTDTFDKVVVFDPTDGNRLSYTGNLQQWRNYQSNVDNGAFRLTNNFDFGNLLVRSILFPKQTLNNEYSTTRDYLSANPFQYARKYAWDDEHFYSNGNCIVFNSREDSSYSGTIDNELIYGTMVTSTYSRQFGDVIPQEDEKIKITATVNDEQVEIATDYNQYNEINSQNTDRETNKAIFKQYMPEILNRENETQSDTGLMTSQHKANIFDIDIRNFWNNMSDRMQSLDPTVQANIKNSIRLNLFKMVEEIKPAHTHLYRVLIDDNDSLNIEPTPPEPTPPGPIPPEPEISSLKLNSQNSYFILSEDYVDEINISLESTNELSSNTDISAIINAYVFDDISAIDDSEF